MSKEEVIYDEDGVEVKIKKDHTNVSRKIQGVTPLICTAVFLILGLFFDCWHPGWMVFLLIPVIEILASINTLNAKARVMLITIIVAIGLHIGLGIYLTSIGIVGAWWKLLIVYLLIPIMAVVTD